MRTHCAAGRQPLVALAVAMMVNVSRILSCAARARPPAARRPLPPASTAGATLVAAALCLPLLASGCGGASSAAPAPVRQALAGVEAALQARDYTRARADLNQLIAATITARGREQLSPAQAGDVLTAAARLRADLPAPRPRAPAPIAPGQPGSSRHNDGGGDSQGDGGGD